MEYDQPQGGKVGPIEVKGTWLFISESINLTVTLSTCQRLNPKVADVHFEVTSITSGLSFENFLI